MIIDNAITYPQDRNAREWTFNYYTDNAKGGLLTLAKRWNSVGAVLDAKRKVPKGSTTSQRRWNLYHDAFENGLERLTAELKEQKRNLSDVFGDNVSVRRCTAIEEIFTKM